MHKTQCERLAELVEEFIRRLCELLGENEEKHHKKHKNEQEEEEEEGEASLLLNLIDYEVTLYKT